MPSLNKNLLKAGLLSGQKQIGLWCTVTDGVLVEMMATTGYDWLLFDTEHGAMSIQDTLPLLQTIAPYPTSAVVRPGWNDPVELKRLLDMGVQSFLVPYVQSADEARAAVSALRYAPEGMRGVAGYSRATAFGMIPDYFDKAHEELCLIVQIESESALNQVEEIAAVDGVDAVFIGPADLSASMGYTGQPDHPDMQKVVLDGIRRITAAGKPAGVISFDSAFMQKCAEAGATFLGVGFDAFIMRDALLNVRQEWR